MAKLHLSKEDILWTFNHPDKKLRISSPCYQYCYKLEKKIDNYIVGIQCFWAADNERWVITSCWYRNT